MQESQNSSDRVPSVAVVGGGSWGTAIAELLASNGTTVHLWVREPEIAEQIMTLRENKVFLPGVQLSPNILAGSDLEAVVEGQAFIVMVVPSHVMRSVAQSMAPGVQPDALLVSASKGVELATHKTMVDVLRDVFPGFDRGQFAVLSGPSFASEVARKMPTVVTVACSNHAHAEALQMLFAAPHFRVYTHDDVLGVELGGTVKNVIAIAAGIIDGMGLGLNTRAALLTRGLAEIRRLGAAMGANPETFIGLAGVGDLLLTATGPLSRNYTLGIKIGKGSPLGAILKDMKMVAEGVKNAETVVQLAEDKGVEMPITQAVFEILYHDLDPVQALHQLMTRDLKPELESFDGS